MGKAGRGEREGRRGRRGRGGNHKSQPRDGCSTYGWSIRYKEPVASGTTVCKEGEKGPCQREDAGQERGGGRGERVGNATQRVIEI